MSGQVTFLQPAEVKSRLEAGRDDVLVLDVRDDDYPGGHIVGCVNIPSHLLQSQTLDQFITEHLIQGVTTVVVHCYLSQQRGPLCARRRVTLQLLSVGSCSCLPDVATHPSPAFPSPCCRLANRLLALNRAGQPEVCVLASGWRRFHQLYGDTCLCEYD